MFNFLGSQMPKHLKVEDGISKAARTKKMLNMFNFLKAHKCQKHLKITKTLENKEWNFKERINKKNVQSVQFFGGSQVPKHVKLEHGISSCA